MTTTYNPYEISYGGLTIGYTKTTYDSTPVYSPDGVDFLYNHVTITAQGIINRNQTYNFVNDITGEQTHNGPAGSNRLNNADVISLLQSQLCTPRQRLVYTDAGGNVIIDTGGGLPGSSTYASIDSNNGPKAEGQLFTPDGFTFFATIKVETWQAYNVNLSQYNAETGAFGTFAEAAPANTVLSNRWEMNQTIDQNNLSTYTTNGWVIIRTDSQYPGSTDIFTFDRPFADAFRGLPSPVRSIFPNCVRVEQSFRYSADGTRIEYTIRDQEKYRPATVPVTSWTANYRQQQTVAPDSANAGLVIGTFTGTATAPPNVLKQEIFAYLTLILFSRINAVTDIILDLSVDESLDENTISMQASCYQMVGKQNASPSGSTGSTTPPLNSFSIRLADPTIANAQYIGLGGPVYPIDSDPTVEGSIPIQPINSTNDTPGLLNPAKIYSVPGLRFFSGSHSFNGAGSAVYTNNIPVDQEYTAASIIAQIYINNVNKSLLDATNGVTAFPYYNPAQQATSAPTTTANASGAGKKNVNIPSTYNGVRDVFSTGNTLLASLQSAEVVVQQELKLINKVFPSLYTNFLTQTQAVDQNTPVSQGFNPTPYLKSDVVAHWIESPNRLQMGFGSTPANNQGSSPTQPIINGQYVTPTCAIFDMSQPTTMYAVYFHGQRINATPEIPDPNTVSGSSNNFVLVHKKVTTPNSVFLPGGVNRLYTITGVWVYASYATANIGGDGMTIYCPASMVDTQGVNNQKQSNTQSGVFIYNQNDAQQNEITNNNFNTNLTKV